MTRLGKTLVLSAGSMVVALSASPVLAQTLSVSSGSTITAVPDATYNILTTTLGGSFSAISPATLSAGGTSTENVNNSSLASPATLDASNNVTSISTLGGFKIQLPAANFGILGTIAGGTVDVTNLTFTPGASGLGTISGQLNGGAAESIFSGSYTAAPVISGVNTLTLSSLVLTSTALTDISSILGISPSLQSQLGGAGFGTYAATLTATPVPEASLVVSWGLGILGLGTIARRKLAKPSALAA